MDLRFSVSNEERWRAEDNEQTALNNARLLWSRFVLQTKTDVVERSQQVRNLSTQSALVAGFAVASFLEFNFEVNDVPPGLAVAYATTTALVVTMNVLAMSSCQLLSASLLKMPEIYVSKKVEARFIFQCREFALRGGSEKGVRPPRPRRDFSKLWAGRCRGEWRRSFCLFLAGTPLFLMNMVLAAWIKFEFYTPGATSMTVIIGFALACLLLTESGWIYTSPRRKLDLSGEVEPMEMPFNWWLPPRPWPPDLPFTEAATQPDAEQDTVECEVEEEERQWRRQDLAQRTLDNARYLWLQFVQRTTDSVEEHGRQLRDLSFAAGVVDSFAMSALLQLTFEPDLYQPPLLIAFACCLGITVGLMTVCLAMLTFINFSIVKTRARLVSETQEALFIARCHSFASTYRLGERPPAPVNSFRKHWEGQCEAEWRRCLLMFMLGLCVLQLMLIAAAWIKFPEGYRQAAWAMTVVLLCGLAWLLAIYLRWGPHAISKMKADMVGTERALQPAGLPWDWHLPPEPRRTTWHPPPDPSDPGPAFLNGAAHAREGSRSSGTLHESSADCEPAVLSPARMRVLLQEWRREDGLQTNLNNAVALWNHFVVRSAHELNTRQDQLNTLAELASVFLGFMMISFLQFSFDATSTPGHLQIFFVATAALTVSLNAGTMTTCGLMVESLLVAASSFTSSEEQACFIRSCYDYARGEGGGCPPRPARNIVKHWDLHFEAAFRRALISFGLGVPSFVLNAIASGWILWQDYDTPPASVTFVFGLGMLYLLLFNVRFTRQLIFRPKQNTSGLEACPNPVGLPFDWHLPSASSATNSVSLRRHP